MIDEPVDILLVDDNPNDVELALHTLRRFAQAERIRVVRDGVEALDFLFCTDGYRLRSPLNLPRLALIDLKLPRLDGLEVLRRIKSDPLRRSLPVVMLTSSNQACDVQECYSLGANSYIIKPVDFDQFNRNMQTLCEYWLNINHPLED